jgi:hypothetical protein
MMQTNPGYAVGQEKSAERTREIPSYLNELGSYLQAHQKQLELLSNRLMPILRSEPPSPSNLDELRKAGSTPLGAQLMQIVETVNNCQRMAQGLLDRLEV